MQQTKHSQGMLRCHVGTWESMEEMLHVSLRNYEAVTYEFRKTFGFTLREFVTSLVKGFVHFEAELRNKCPQTA